MSHPQDFSARPSMKQGFKTGRRQHRSCDQCRKGKRACDVAFAKEPGGNSDDITALGPCSNCKRTGKSCTLQWLRAVHHASLRPRADLSTTPNSNNSSTSDSDAPKLEDTPAPQPHPQPLQTAVGARTDPHPAGVPLSAAYSYPYSPPVDDAVLASLLPQHQQQQQQQQQQHEPWSTSTFDYLALRTVTDPLDDDFRFDNSHHAPLQQQHQHQQSDFNPQFFPAAPSTVSSGHSTSGLYLQGGAGWDYDETDASPESVEQQFDEMMPWRSSSVGQRARSPSAASFSSFLEHLQPSSHAQSRLAQAMNQSVLTKGLWKVYHDSFENALSCWLTEKTCPYTYQMVPAAGDAGSESLADVWGPSWGNRIVGRVCHLDKSWAKLRNRPVSHTEDQAASRALQLSIMAFATQWAQGSQRSSAQYSANAMDGTLPLDGEFDRMLQESLWHQARRALQDAADCESFRVVLAHVIFSFTQKPLNLDQHVDAEGDGEDSSKLDDIIDSEGPPIFLEAATRQVFAHRAKFHSMAGRNSSPSSQGGPASKLDSADRKTFDMMFWLCVMFDTLSAVMNDRPLVVSDKDSKIRPDRAKTSEPTPFIVFGAHSSGELFADGAFSSTLPEEPQSDLWGDLFLKSKPIRWNQGLPRWPCTYEEAAITLCNAAPVKVLLYRKVARLQTLMSRATTKPEKMEASITESIKVYQHWNTTYGHFFADCIADHDNLPARIQSWYVILKGHWHLAALSLTDMIQRIDDNALGLASQQKLRERARLVQALRKENAFALADLGRVSSPSVGASFARAREFHFAVNKGALLTEPWTVVLVRSFAKAARVLLDCIPPSPTSNSPTINMNAAAEYMRRCDHCIKALWYLGRKSDMAFLAATFLSNSLKAKAQKLAALSAGAGPTPQSNVGPTPQPQPQQQSSRRSTVDSGFYNNDLWQGAGWADGERVDASLYASL